MRETRSNQTILNPDLGGPKKIEEMDVPVPLMEDIMLRYLYGRGSSSLNAVSDALKLSFAVVQTLFNRLRERSMFEVTGMSGHDYHLTLSAPGREYAAKLYDTCHYSGPVPVSMSSYRQVVADQVPEVEVDRLSLKQSLSDLVLTDQFLDQLGPALMTRNPIFLYGPSGNGKTFVASRVNRIYDDAVLIPYALEFDGQIIVVYDPSVHERVEGGDYSGDPRWVLCRRPFVLCGGELAPAMLELHADDSSNVYAAPVQIKANNGILVIDDFGRQNMSPQFLLNRWIVPLERNLDFLTLKYGAKFEIPFEMNVVFATNLEPTSLVDDAFLRRIKNKIFVEPVSPEVFDRIFYRLVEEQDLPCDPDAAEFLRGLCLTMGPKKLQACIPADIIDIIDSISRYEGQPIQLNGSNIERAADLYFTKPQEFVDE